MNEQDQDSAPRNIFGWIVWCIPPLAYLGRCLDEGRYGPVVVFALLAIAAIVAAVMQWGVGVIGVVAVTATFVVGMIILSLTT